jgi:class 3 adenylate cyclase
MATAVPRSVSENLLAQGGGPPAQDSLKEYLLAHPNMDSRQLVEQLSEEIVRLVNVDLSQAEKIAGIIQKLSENLQDSHCLARSHRAQGHVLFTHGKYSHALEEYQDALTLFERLGEEVEAGRTLSSALQTLIYLGHYNQALAWAQKARGIFERSGDRLRLARLHLNMGNIYCRQDRFAEALELYYRAFDILAQEGHDQDVVAVLLNMAVCHAELEDFERAKDAYEQAQSYCREKGLSVASVEIDYNFASLHYRLGDHEQAVLLYEKARRESESAGDRYHSALCDLDLAELFLEQNRAAQSAELAQRAAHSFQKLELNYESAKAITTLAIAADRCGETARAIDLFRQARELFSQDENRVWPHLVDIYCALSLYQEGSHKDARHLCESAIRRLRGRAETERSKWKHLFEQYVSPQVADEVWDTTGKSVLTGQERTATVLFADIRNFTGITAGKSPREALAWLNNYFTSMSDTIRQNRGFLNKFIGDGMLVVFGLPLCESIEDDACRAVQTALDMQLKVEELNLQRKPGDPPIEIGIGIHTGPLIAGNVGSYDRLEYSVIGETVNLASRLEGITKRLNTGIVISTQTRDALQGSLPTDFLGEFTVRGLQQRVPLYTVTRP